RQPGLAAPLLHERAVERLAVDRAADLHEPAGAEELRRIVHHHARPRTWVVALLKPGVELSQHDSRHCRRCPNASRPMSLRPIRIANPRCEYPATGAPRPLPGMPVK